MTKTFQNFHIGTKLAIASLLSLALLVIMIYAQADGGTKVRRGYEAAVRQQTVAQLAAEVKASVRGMLLAFRDVVLAATPAELQKSTDHFAAEQLSADGLVAAMAKLVPSGEAQTQIDRLPRLVAELSKSRAEVAALRSRIIGLQSGTGERQEDAPARIEQLNDNIARLRHDVSLPIAAEIESQVGKLVDFGRQSSRTSIDAAAAESALVERISLVIGLAVALVLIGSCVVSIFTIARPIRALSASMLELAEGNFGVVLPGLGRGDEVGEVAGAVEKFKIKAQQRAALEAEQQLELEHRAAEQRKTAMHQLARDFEGAVGEIIDTVTSASTEMEATASTLSSTAVRAEQLTTTVAAASEQASANVQSVASATEEMTSSVNEISRQVQDSARLANEAVGHARTTNDRVGALSQAASRIGAVVELINTIAGQTNLLALNATIEAARAGDAGRGFAVVASEVKALAEQTAKATGEIGTQITGIQDATRESVGAIRDIGDVIGRMAEVAATIAAAVEQQGTATQEISRNVQQAAQGTLQVSSNISDVQRGASETGAASAHVLAAAKSLSADSQRLKLEVGKFLDTVRAA